MSEENPPDFLPLSESNVAIIGLGLMGGSLAMDLAGRCRTLTGIDQDPSVLELAGRKGFADRLGELSDRIIAGADVIILATPVCSIMDLLLQLPEIHPEKAVVLDLGSTKTGILERMQEMPGRFDPLGGHPMCGKEHNSLRYAEPGLFKGAPFALCALERTSSAAREMGLQIVQAVEAVAVWMDAPSHDRFAAATSHVPFLAANALAACTPLEAACLVGPGFSSTTRAGETDPRIMIEVMQSNRLNVIQSLNLYREKLEEMEKMLEKREWEALEEALISGCSSRQRILAAVERGRGCV